jgi:hypothetical protein
MLIQIKNQVFVPEAQIKRISFFSDYAIIKYVDHSEERVDGDDAERMKAQLDWRI